jgi:signal transduction histidine kinase
MGLSIFKSKNETDKRKLEAFMNALPFEYCGWNDSGHVSWSRDFPSLFGLNSITTIRDIQTAILPSDAAALEGMIFTLKKDGEPFTLSVKTIEDHRIITLHGQAGQDLDGVESYDVLWAEDTTMKHHAADEMAENLEELRRKVDNYRMCLDHLPQSVWVTNDDATIEWCNDQYTKLVDATRDDILNGPEKFNPVLLQSEKISVAEMTKKALEQEEADHAVGRYILHGKRTLQDIHITPMRDINYVVHSAYDITEQEELRAELKRYVAANGELMQQLSSAIAIFAANHKLEFYNQAFSSLWGLEESWLNTHPVLGDILEKLREMRRLPEQADFRAYKQQWLDMFTSLIDQHQTMLHLPDGVAIRLMVVPHPMGGLMMTFEDVTSRLELESSYNTLIAVQKETLDNLGEGVAVFGSDARLKFYNPSYLKLWGLNPETLEGHPHISEIVARKKKFFKGQDDNWDAIKTRLSSYVVNRSDTKETIFRSDGTILECAAVSLPDGGVMITYRNVTDSAKVKEALEDRNRALMDAEKLKTDFLANVSYQLRTPLNAISGFSEILNNEYFGEINDKQREYTQGITEAAGRLASLIDDILDLSSIEAGYLRLDKKEENILEMMTHIYDLTRDWAGMDNQKITLKKPRKKAITLTMDQRRIKQAVINIIRNAISYTPSGGKIGLSLEEDDNTIIIRVSDTGIGIPEDEQDKIFEPFQAIAHSEEGTKRPDTGLGLSLAKNIIAMHDGDITIDSVLGGGTTVTITLPKDNDE